MNGFNLVRSSEPLQKRPIVVTLYGQPGLGKTTAMFTMPRPVHMDFDRGIARAEQKLRPDYYSITNFGEFWAWVQTDDFEKVVLENEYKSIILDTAGSMIDDFMIPYVASSNAKNRTATGGLTLAGWGVMGTLVNDLRNRFMSLGLHIAIIAHDKDLGDDSPVRIGLSVKGQSSDLVTRISDQLGYVQSLGGKRIIDFSHSQKHLGKDTGKIGTVEIPNINTAEYDTFMSDMVDAIQDKMVSASQAQIEAGKIVDTYREGIALCESPASFEDMSKKIGQETNKAVILQLRHLMKSAMKEKGVTYDKESNSFVKKEATNEA